MSCSCHFNVIHAHARKQSQCANAHTSIFGQALSSLPYQSNAPESGNFSVAPAEISDSTDFSAVADETFVLLTFTLIASQATVDQETSKVPTAQRVSLLFSTWVPDRASSQPAMHKQTYRGWCSLPSILNQELFELSLSFAIQQVGSPYKFLSSKTTGPSICWHVFGHL